MERYVEAESYPFPYNGDLRPQNSAVLVIDMQMDFCGYGGWADAAGANMNVMRAPIEGHMKVLRAARENGFHVVYTREGHRADGSDLMEVKQFRISRTGAGIGDSTELGRILIRGEPGWEIIPELTPQPDDPIVDKPGSGAFYSTELEHILLRRGVRNLIIMG